MCIKTYIKIGYNRHSWLLYFNVISSCTFLVDNILLARYLNSLTWGKICSLNLMFSSSCTLLRPIILDFMFMCRQCILKILRHLWTLSCKFNVRQFPVTIIISLCQRLHRHLLMYLQALHTLSSQVINKC